MKRNAGIDMLAPKLPLRVAYWAASTEGPAITLSLECGEFLLRGVAVDGNFIGTI